MCSEVLLKFTTKPCRPLHTPADVEITLPIRFCQFENIFHLCIEALLSSVYFVYCTAVMILSMKKMCTLTFLELVSQLQISARAILFYQNCGNGICTRYRVRYLVPNPIFLNISEVLFS